MNKTTVAMLAIGLVFGLGGATSAATISTDDFDYGGGYPTETGWGGTGPASMGQWTLAAVPAGGNGRTTIDNNSFGYNPPAGQPSSPGYGQFSNGVNAAWTGTISDTAGHAFNAGDKVSIDFFTAGRPVDSGPLTFNVSLVGPATLSYGTFAPASQTAWNQVNTGDLTVATAGTYNVLFSSLAQSSDRTTFIDNVSYIVTPIPEPSTLTLAAVGLLGLRRRRR